MGSGPDLTVAVPDAAAPMTVTLAQPSAGVPSRMDCSLLDDAGRQAARAYAQASKHHPTRLRLPPSCLLERSLLLPAAAGRDMAAVLGYEMDRITPFSVDAVFWQFAVEPRAGGLDRLKVKLSIIPKAPWQPLIAALAATGIVISTIEVPRPDDRICRIDVDRDLSQRERRARRRRRVVAGVYGAVAIATIILPFVVQAMARASVERQIAGLRDGAAEAQALRDRIAQSASSTAIMAAEQGRSGDALAVLKAVTEALPDDTYLTALSLRDGRLALSGQSAVAAKLIGALSETRLIRNAAFAAPTIRAEQSKVEVFSIQADIAPAGDPPPLALKKAYP